MKKFFSFTYSPQRAKPPPQTFLMTTLVPFNLLTQGLVMSWIARKIALSQFISKFPLFYLAQAQALPEIFSGLGTNFGEGPRPTGISHNGYSRIHHYLLHVIVVHMQIVVAYVALMILITLLSRFRSLAGLPLMMLFCTLYYTATDRFGKL